MIRTHTFAALMTGGVCLALVGHHTLDGERSAWDSREAASGFLDQKASPHDRRAARAGTSDTASRWGRPRLVRAVARVGDGPLEPTGARISLVSYGNVTSTLSACDDGPLVVPFISVTVYYTLNSPCSSIAGGAKQTCSVKSASGASCSATGATNSKYCSTGTNGGGPTNNTCSVILSSISTCSALAGSNDSCSTQSDQTTGGGYCSVTGPANPVQTDSSCSTGGYGGAPAIPAATDTCSALPTNGNGLSTNPTTCSIYNIGLNGGNQTAVCSADGQTSSTCSVLSSSANDFCSVNNSNGGGHGGKCTVVGAPANGSTNAQCSVLPGGTGGNCSILNSNGSYTPNVPALTGICYLP
jgi:hypothetical protein